MVNAESDLLNELAQQLQDAVQYLDRSRLRITRHANRLNNSRNPAVSLPKEVIAEVLFAGLPKVKTHSDWMTYLQYTRAIPSVCQRWREVALEYSRLWNSLLISKHAAESSDAQWLNEDLARRLILSRQTDIHATISLLSSSNTLNWNREFLSNLHPHLQQIKTLSLSVSDVSLLHRFFGIILPRMSHLTVKIRHLAKDRSDGVLPARAPPDTLPNLKHMRLTAWSPKLNVTLVEIAAVLGLRAKSISLHLAGTHFENLHLIVEDFAQAETLELKIGPGRPPSVLNPPPIHLPNLRTLHYEQEFDEPQNFFSRLDAPILDTLKLSKECRQAFPTPITLPALRHIVSGNRATSRVVALDRVINETSVRSLKLYIGSVDLFKFATLLASAPTPINSIGRRWPSLKSLSISISTEACTIRGSGVARAHTVVKMMNARPSLVVEACIGPTPAAEVMAWVERTKELFGD